MKQYFQRSFQLDKGDIVIHQYVQALRPSGLLVPKRISEISVTSEVSTENFVAALNEKFEFHYEPNPEVYKIAVAEAVRPVERFCVGPYPPQEFCDQSSRVIVSAFEALTCLEIQPHLEFEFMNPPDEELAEDDREMLRAVASTVSNIINGVHDAPFAGGHYL